MVVAAHKKQTVDGEAFGVAANGQGLHGGWIEQIGSHGGFQEKEWLSERVINDDQPRFS
jgi:hypothetical protein